MAFPNVPNVPGVPPLPRDPFAIAAGVVLLAADAIGIFGTSLNPEWGIFKSGVPVVIADNVVSVDFKRDWNLADFPIEQGAFESYDKVQVPFDARVRFSAGGAAEDREALLISVQRVAASLDLFDVVTPEITYTNVNVVHYDYRRQARGGLGLLVVDVWCQEVRVTATATFSNTQAPASASAVNDGTVQTTAAASAQVSKLPEVQ